VERRPTPGDEVYMPSMGDDVYIEISEVPEEQPLLKTDGCFIVKDQYGETHLVEEGDAYSEADVDDTEYNNGSGSWTSINFQALSDEGVLAWASYREAATSADSSAPRR